MLAFNMFLMAVPLIVTAMVPAVLVLLVWAWLHRQHARDRGQHPPEWR